MNLQSNQKTLRSLTVQVIPINGGVIVKRGCLEVKLVGEGVEEALDAILSATHGQGTTTEAIQDLVGPAARPQIGKLIGHLLSRGVLTSDPSLADPGASAPANEEIFYWHFGQSCKQVHDHLKTRRLVILGINLISRQLISALMASGFQNIRVIDHVLLRNLRLFHEDGTLNREVWNHPSVSPEDSREELNPQSIDCLVAASDFGFSPVLYKENEFCIQHTVHFLPLVLDNLMGYVGPLVVRGETACYQCLRARQNAHITNHEAKREVENASFEGQAVVGFHPAMASILAEVAAFELTRLYSGALPASKVGTVMEINLLAGKMNSRRVLKMPRCPICSPLNTRPSISVTKDGSAPRFEPIP